MHKVWLKKLRPIYTLGGGEINRIKHTLDLKIRVISLTTFQEAAHTPSAG